MFKDLFMINVIADHNLSKSYLELAVVGKEMHHPDNSPSRATSVVELLLLILSLQILPGLVDD